MEICSKDERADGHLDVSVDDLVVMQISEPLQDLLGVEDDGCFVVFQRSPLGAQQRGQTSYKQDRCQSIKDPSSKKLFWC